jgi:hypothetical protein
VIAPIDDRRQFESSRRINGSDGFVLSGKRLRLLRPRRMDVQRRKIVKSMSRTMQLHLQHRMARIWSTKA